MTLNVYVCNFESDQSLKAKGLTTKLIDFFQPAKLQSQQLQRSEIALDGSADQASAHGASAKA